MWHETPSEREGTPTDPHGGGGTVHFGPELDAADAAVILMHGRGDSAHGILLLAPELRVPGVAFLAPQASGGSWYPESFLAPIEVNEPWLSSALRRIAALAEDVAASGILPERTVLMGFSQGACLALEFAARNARRYGGVVAFSGGLIGRDGTPRDYDGSMEGTPVFLGCSDIDPHIPLTRAQESARIMEGLGGEVDERIYPGMGHTVNEDELEWAHQLLKGLTGESA